MVVFYRVLFVDTKYNVIDCEYCLFRWKATWLASEASARKSRKRAGKVWTKVIVTEIRLSEGKPEYYPVIVLP